MHLLKSRFHFRVLQNNTWIFSQESRGLSFNEPKQNVYYPDLIKSPPNNHLARNQHSNEHAGAFLRFSRVASERTWMKAECTESNGATTMSSRVCRLHSCCLFCRNQNTGRCLFSLWNTLPTTASVGSHRPLAEALFPLLCSDASLRRICCRWMMQEQLHNNAIVARSDLIYI